MTPALSVARVVRIVGSYQFVFCINSSEEVSDLFLNLGVVFVGGGLGAVARFLLGFVVNQKNMGYPGFVMDQPLRESSGFLLIAADLR